MSNMKKIVIVGATSSMAEHCARLWVREPVELVLVGRDISRLEVVAADLCVRSPQSHISVMSAAFLEPKSIKSAVNAIAGKGTVDVALIAHGALPDQANCQGDLQACCDALEINGVSPVLFAEAFANHMESAGKGTVAIIGSVAGDRGRKSNYVYGAAKGLVERYVEGMRHRFAESAVKVVLIKPGPTDTPMTAHLKAQGAKLASVGEAAVKIVQAIEQGCPVAYVPGKWRLIMWVIRHLPSFVFNRLNI